MQIYSFTKINAIPQISTSGGDVYYASRNLLIHLFFHDPPPPIVLHICPAILN